MSNNTTTQTDVCLQRSRRMSMAPAMVRMELTSPYTTPSPYTSSKNTKFTNTSFTKFQLDMRRKAEILKYSSSSQSTQTNSQTKQQRWSQIARGAIQKQFVYNPVTQTATVNPCIGDATIPSLTSSCDVPGPIIQLYEDPSVPLYNYAYNNRSNPNNDVTPTNPWNILTYPNQVFYSDIPNMALSIAFTQKSISPNASVPIQIPVNMNIHGVLDSRQTIAPVTFAVTSIQMNVMFNTTRLLYVTLPPTAITGNTSLTWDMSSNLNTQRQFNLTQNMGMLSVALSGIPTINNYIYDIILLFRITTSARPNFVFSNSTVINKTVIAYPLTA